MRSGFNKKHRTRREANAVQVTAGQERSSRQGTTAGIAEPYLALIACTIFLAIRRCVAVLMWKPSHEKARPNGDPLKAAFVFGNGAICDPAGGTVCSESNIALRLRYAQPRAVASV